MTNSSQSPGYAIEAEKLVKRYATGRRTIQALRGVSLQVEPGEYVSITGPSGCGKSTMLNLLAGLDVPTSGTLSVFGTELSCLNQNQLARWRGANVGIIFQFFQLMPTLTALENVMLPIDLRRRQTDARQRAKELLEHVGLGDLEDHLPSELSGGEQQRVAIARALANRPRLLLADEPTGNLDSTSGEIVIDMLESLWNDGATLILVTHDRKLAERASRRISMLDGQIVEDVNGDRRRSGATELSYARTAS